MSITAEDRIEAAGWAVKTLRALGRTDLEDVIRIEWKQAFTARLGDALYGRAGSVSLRGPRGSRSSHQAVPSGSPSARVRFSIPLWPRATKTEQYETVVHEICHIVTAHEAALAGKGVPTAHGWEWKATMRRAGVKPERCHSLDRTGLKKTRKTIPATCGCGATGTHPVTPYIAGRIAAGSKYSCGKCHSYIRVEVKVAPVAKKSGGRRRVRRVRRFRL